MKVNKILVPAVVLVATMDSKVEAANCVEICEAGLASCMAKCAMFGAFLPLGAVGCAAGCGIVTAGCLAICNG